MQFPKERPKEYLSRLAALYSDIKSWVRSVDIEPAEYEVRLLEEAFGAYMAPALKLYFHNRMIAEVRPMGAAIIGASGRVDFVGAVASFVALYLERLEKGKLRVAIPGTVGNDSRTRQGPPLFVGAMEAGWYLIQDRAPQKALPLNKDVCLNVLESVSDHAFTQRA